MRRLASAVEIPLRYTRVTEPARRVARAFFWIVFYAFGVLLTFAALRMVGGRTPAALIVQSGWLIWVIAVFLHIGGHRRRYVVAALGILLLWLPLLHREVSVGLALLRLVREDRVFDPDSPMGLPAFLMGEMVMFGPPTLLLWILVRYKPWRDGPVGVA
jgi:hypothetical protein